MTKRTASFLASTGTPDEAYGLYVMEAESPHHTDDFILVDRFDSDHFKRWPRELLAHFAPAAELTSCKDEYGDVYTGDALKARIREAINAYVEELPGNLRAEAVLDESLKDVEQ